MEERDNVTAGHFTNSRVKGRRRPTDQFAILLQLQPQTKKAGHERRSHELWQINGHQALRVCVSACVRDFFCQTKFAAFFSGSVRLIRLFYLLPGDRRDKALINLWI